MATKQLADRVTELEILVTHLQRELAELNQVATDQQRQIDALGRQVTRLLVGNSTTVDAAAEIASDGGSATDDAETEDWNE